ncbi:hypothetical protein D3C73_618190 [compost metagenome]
MILFDFLYIIIRISNWDDSTIFNKHRELPDWHIKIIDNTPAFILLTCKIIDPLSIWQVNTIANIIAFLIYTCFLIDRCNQKIRSIQILVLRCFTKRILICLFQKHRTDDWQTIDSLFGNTIAIRNQL